MVTIIERAPAKINLGLDIQGNAQMGIMICPWLWLVLTYATM